MQNTLNISRKNNMLLNFFGHFPVQAVKEKMDQITTPDCLRADVLRLWELGIAFEPPRLVAWIPAIAADGKPLVMGFCWETPTATNSFFRDHGIER